jgi:hypothetical protein
VKSPIALRGAHLVDIRLIGEKAAHSVEFTLPARFTRRFKHWTVRYATRPSCGVNDRARKYYLFEVLYNLNSEAHERGYSRGAEDFFDGEVDDIGGAANSKHAGITLFHRRPR